MLTIFQTIQNIYVCKSPFQLILYFLLIILRYFKYCNNLKVHCIYLKCYTQAWSCKKYKTDKKIYFILFIE